MPENNDDLLERAQLLQKAKMIQAQKMGQQFPGQPGPQAEERPWISGKGIMDAFETTGRSALETISLGASEPLMAGVHATDRSFDDLVKGKGVSGENFGKYYDESVDRRRELKKNAPISNIGGGLLGAFAPFGPAAAIANKVTGAVGKGVSRVLPELEAGGGKLVQGLKNLYGNSANVAKGAAQGAAGALALEAPRQVIEGSTGFIKKGDEDVPDLGGVGLLGAKFGGAIPAIGVAARGVKEGGKWGGKKLMASFLGPSEAHIDHYLANPGAVNGAKSIEELKDKVDKITDGLRESVENGSKTVAEAKQALKDLEQSIAQHRKDSNVEFRITKTEIKQALRHAKDDLEKAFEGEVGKLKDVKAPIDLADEANLAVRDLKGKIVEGSREATESLAGGAGDVIKTHPIVQVLKNARERLNIGEHGPITPQAKAAAKEIDGLIETVGGSLKMDKNGERVGGMAGLSFGDTKKLIQQLDRSEKALYDSGQFSDDVGIAYKEMRRALDAQLKELNPNYKKLMEPVAENSGLHSEVADAFGERQSAISKLNNISNPSATVAREGLIKLGKQTGRDFETPINAHINAQNKLKNPAEMERIRQGLPEYAPHQELEKFNQSLEGPSAQLEYVDKKLAGSGLLEKEKEAAGLLAKSEEGLLGAKGKLEPFKNVTPNSSEARLKTAMNARPGEQVELKRQLEDLSKLSDTDFVAALKDLKTKNAFSGQDTNGSRKVNLFGMIIGGAAAGVGQMLGHGMLGAGIGVPIGATAGAIADKYGPKIAKQILDAAIKIEGSPTLAKIQALKVPPQVKAYLVKELADYNKAPNAND